jgi:hypothetical protein
MNDDPATPVISYAQGSFPRRPRSLLKLQICSFVAAVLMLVINGLMILAFLTFEQTAAGIDERTVFDWLRFAEAGCSFVLAVALLAAAGALEGRWGVSAISFFWAYLKLKLVLAIAFGLLVSQWFTADGQFADGVIVGVVALGTSAVHPLIAWSQLQFAGEWLPIEESDGE